MNKVKLIGAGIVLIVITVIAFTLFEFKTVKGGELGIKETWGGGVVNEVLQPKNYYQSFKLESPVPSGLG